MLAFMSTQTFYATALAGGNVTTLNRFMHVECRDLAPVSSRALVFVHHSSWKVRRRRTMRRVLPKEVAALAGRPRQFTPKIKSEVVLTPMTQQQTARAIGRVH